MMKYVDVIPTAKEASMQNVGSDTAVVIDVLRATSVMVTALNNGAAKIIPVLTPEEAFEVKSTSPEVLLGGERLAEKIDGFDFGNSPLSYSADYVAGKTIVMTTTNGTRAILNSASAKHRYIACFLNARQVARQLREHQHIVFICSGADDSFTLEDALCAGYIIYLMKQDDPGLAMSDFALAMMSMYSAAAFDVRSIAANGRHYRVLKDKGFLEDLDYCFSASPNSRIPVCVNQHIELL